MNIEIPSDYGPLVQKLLSDGRFHNEAEVVAEGLRLVAMREKLHEDVEAGFTELDVGRRIDAKDVYAEAQQRIKAIEDQPLG